MSAGDRIALAASGAVALVLRVVLVLATSHFTPDTDAADFDRQAVSLAQTGHLPAAAVLSLHGGPTAFRPPAFPYLLSLVYRLTGTADAHLRWQAGRLMEAVLGTVAVALIFLIARRLLNGRIAAIAAGLAAVYPPLLLIGSSLLSESLFIPLALAALLAGLIARDRLGSGRVAAGLRWCAAAGVLTALGGLSRSNGIVIVLALAVLVWVRRPRWAAASLLAPAVLLLATALALAPWTIRNENAFGQFVPTSTETGFALAGVYNPTVQGGHDLYQGFWEPPLAQMQAILAADPHVNEAEMSDRLTTDAVDYLRAHPFSVVRESYWSLGGLLDLDGANFERWVARLIGYPPTLAVISLYAFWPVALLAVAGGWLLVTRRRRVRLAPTGATTTAATAATATTATTAATPIVWMPPIRPIPAAVWACPILLFLSTLPVAGDTRYRSPVDPFLLLLAAVALDAAARRVPALGRVTARPLASPGG